MLHLELRQHGAHCLGSACRRGDDVALRCAAAAPVLAARAVDGLLRRCRCVHGGHEALLNAVLIIKHMHDQDQLMQESSFTEAHLTQVTCMQLSSVDGLVVQCRAWRKFNSGKPLTHLMGSSIAGNCASATHMAPARTFEMGARQLVVQLALDTICVLGSSVSWLTPITNIGVSLSLAGAEMMTFLAPPRTCAMACTGRPRSVSKCFTSKTSLPLHVKVRIVAGDVPSTALWCQGCKQHVKTVGTADIAPFRW